MLKLFSIDEVRPGMFVNRVTRQTAQLKIKTQGLVKEQGLIEKLKARGILEVEIDLSRSILHQELTMDSPMDDDNSADDDSQAAAAKPQQTEGEALNASHKLYEQAKSVQSQFFKKVRKGGKVSITELMGTSADIIDSVFDNPDALCCLTLIKERDQYLLEHSLNCSILMAVFARHLGFDKELIDELGLAGLLMDVGMATIPEDILSKSGRLDQGETQIVEGHVDFGLELLEQSEMDLDVVRDVIANHHERMDGSGYPRGKGGDYLSVYARMAAIVDSYDAMTSDRPWRKGLPPTQALKRLLSSSQGLLDQSLVQQFIRCVGVHPVGSLVKLKSGKLAIVVRANKQDPLCPVVMSFYSVRTNMYNEIKRLDLSKVGDEIETSVRPEEFKINLTKFFKDVLLKQV
ncbi:HD-GYP domain-containing protein [Bowmanella pacifica]|uniref:Phosphodiesterase n=1 Tax=Bowmanella pacifica TaxID=502051 RepID=A0A918DJA2_9ALTE|nr:HD-GYP domain-containing protein [Bowmanella pacifica]GGO67493.1 phosphodiesterase [Bowmanella pacifica]